MAHRLQSRAGREQHLRAMPHADVSRLLGVAPGSIIYNQKCMMSVLFGKLNSICLKRNTAAINPMMLYYSGFLVGYTYEQGLGLVIQDNE